MMGSGSVALSVLGAPLRTLSFRLPLICSIIPTSASLKITGGEPGVVGHTLIPAPWEAETGESL